MAVEVSDVLLWRSVRASTTHCANESMYVFNVGCVAPQVCR